MFRTIFRRLGEGQFDLGDWDSLWSLLTCVTIRKCGHWKRYFQAQAHDLQREASPEADAAGSSASWQFLDREPGPEEALVLAETVQQILKGLNDQERQVVIHSLQGAAAAKISQAVSCSESKVYRVLRHVRRRLERLRDAADDPPGEEADDSGR